MPHSKGYSYPPLVQKNPAAQWTCTIATNINPATSVAAARGAKPAARNRPPPNWTSPAATRTIGSANGDSASVIGATTGTIGLTADPLTAEVGAMDMMGLLGRWPGPFVPAVRSRFSLLGAGQQSIMAEQECCNWRNNGPPANPGSLCAGCGNSLVFRSGPPVALVEIRRQPPGRRPGKGARRPIAASNHPLADLDRGDR